MMWGCVKRLKFQITRPFFLVNSNFLLFFGVAALCLVKWSAATIYLGYFSTKKECLISFLDIFLTPARHTALPEFCATYLSEVVPNGQ